MEGVLVHDGACACCSAAAALRRLRAAGAVEWDDEAAQTYLAARFGEAPFGVVCVGATGETVNASAGTRRSSSATGQACPRWFRTCGDSSEALAGAVRTLVGADREPHPSTTPSRWPNRPPEPLEGLLAAASPGPYLVTG